MQHLSYTDAPEQPNVVVIRRLMMVPQREDTFSPFATRTLISPAAPVPFMQTQSILVQNSTQADSQQTYTLAPRQNSQIAQTPTENPPAITPDNTNTHAGAEHAVSPSNVPAVVVASLMMSIKHLLAVPLIDLQRL